MPQKSSASNTIGSTVGVIRTNAKGFGFVTITGDSAEKPVAKSGKKKRDEEVVIAPEFVNTALNGDEVEITITGKYFDAKKGRSPRQGDAKQADFVQMAGQVRAVIRRARTQFVGTLVRHDNQWWVRPDDRRAYADFLVPADMLGPVQNDSEKENEKVVVTLVRWQANEQYPTGKITQVIGQKGEHETEIQSILIDRGIDQTFPEPVLAEAKKIEQSEKPLQQAEISRRRDVRSTLTFTIDPVDAKDFDDAISFKKISDGPHTGHYEIGVHIADVSYYVRPGTALDAEALKRSFSVYLVDRTIPMLPEVLSNDLCSLNPEEDRFAFSGIFIVDESGHVHERWFGRTIINSDHRFSYESAQAVLDKNQQFASDASANRVSPGGHQYFPELTALNNIAKKMQRENYKHGAIDFAQDEVKFKLDARGKPIAIVKKERLDTHKLVEEYMLLANREVAEFIHTKQNGHDNSPMKVRGEAGVSIYRIHDLPERERLEELAMFLQALGYNLPVKQGKITARDINVLLESVRGVPEESLIKTATIRSMAKAAYSTQNIGHFGLGFSFYTHFTSPIRRYTDLVVHRVLADILAGSADGQRNLERVSSHASDREIVAAEAERASIKYKQVEYMSERVGQKFTGTISGVTDWGIYIEEVETRCEGMVPLRELGGDYYVFNPKTYTVGGEKTGKKFRLGDTVRFQVARADLDSKTLDYKII